MNHYLSLQRYITLNEIQNLLYLIFSCLLSFYYKFATTVTTTSLFGHTNDSKNYINNNNKVNNKINKLESLSDRYKSIYISYSVSGSLQLHFNRFHGIGNYNNQHTTSFDTLSELFTQFEQHLVIRNGNSKENINLEVNRLYLDISNYCLNSKSGKSPTQPLVPIGVILESLFFFEDVVVDDITVVGSSSLCVANHITWLRSELNRKIDTFLIENRSWNLLDYEYYPVDNRGEILLKLKKIKQNSGRHLLYKELESIQFQSRTFRRLSSRMHQLRTTTTTSDHQVCTADNQHLKVLIYEIGPRGMFSMLHFVAYSLSLSYQFKRMFIVNTTSYSYANHWNDVLLPLSTCEMKDVDIESPQYITELYYSEYDRDRRVTIVENSYMVYYKFRSPRDYPETRFASLLEYRSYIMDWLARPSYETRQMIRRYKQELWGDRLMPAGCEDCCVSVHIRCGDKWDESGVSMTPFDDYFKAILEVTRNATRLHDIFLMTDNSTVIEMLERRSQALKLNLNIRYIKEIVRYSDRVLEVAKELETGRIPSNLKSTYGAQLFSEVHIASECKFFIGTQSSNIGRTITELMAAKNYNSFVSWMSVDNSPWVANP
ncbi:putative N-acetyl-beta-D-glucosaminide alpha-1,6-fucosyltransferase [Heterostelium album PN500]|uniref:Putative N-acetyl-beta-D-glucosaminide alpha-1,6-fucosyltransferase n=1 Tax=Heterostelium pallidum (strain ATCC 26659 / Pp 5 / PN500) TaxID=670386 RepID=D3B5W5_HETP5|nr:putative N-acetyl-beta-D-glucosaminide alpha-1,6-fucosyltransferase [Heterostelium album PN500]EFA83263.1 putative N-acetyl-beta-D-glucosaminide alpha-1,6-fucosyltransferase [Heterostelium album PN500]|eukprot:XP_020435380.1 putative N-acetyl-beta-D-glucosaminide alpha-1,6-fucosyltransferase [Heterostelium album PN500]